jgi:ribosomal protein S18 acetylase RimI-like enzyme
MRVEFRRVPIPDEIDALLAFDRRAFVDFQADLFDADDWTGFISYWMIVNGETVGCSAVVHDAHYDETAKPGSLWIASTGILPEHRRKGFGQMPKEWQIVYARERGFKEIVTNMRKSNHPIIALNEKLGFTTREISAEYYSEPDEDAIVMRLQLCSR